MKKKQIRYMGAVAAALLAVAPVSIGAIGQIAQPSLAQAATTPDESADYKAGEVAGAQDAKDLKDQQSLTDKSTDYQNGYSVAYQDYFNGFSEALNEAQGKQPNIPTDASQYWTEGLNDGQALFPNLLKEIKEKAGQLGVLIDRQSDDAMRDAIRDISGAFLNISNGFNGTAASTALSELKTAMSKINQALTPRATPYDSNDPQQKQAEIDSGKKAGQADVSGLIDADKYHADNSRESQEFQDAYDAAFYSTNAKNAAVAQAMALQPLPTSFPGKPDSYITAYKAAYQDAEKGIYDGTVSAFAGKPDESGQADDTAYSNGFDNAYMQIQYNRIQADPGVEAGLADAKAQAPKKFKDGNGAYNYAYNATYDDYTSGFQLGSNDSTSKIAEKTDAELVPAGTLKGPNYTVGYHDGYKKATDDAKAAFERAVQDANNAIQSGKYQENTDAMRNLKGIIADPGDTEAHVNNAGSYNDIVTTIRGYISQLTPKPTTPPVTYPAPEFTYADGFQKDITLNQGAAFDSQAGISAWTDSSKSTAIPAADWTVTGSVDTSKPGTYTLTYTIKNGYNQTASFTRTITVVAGATTGVKFSDINKVIYVQASNADQYSYDANTGKFTKNDALASLSMASGWKTAQQAITVDGVTYYQVGANGWLNGVDITTARMVEEAGIVSVTNGAGAQTVDNAADGKAVKTLNNGSAWKYFASANGYYLVANDEWVKADDVQTVAVAAQGTFKAGHSGALLYDEAGNEAGRVLRANSSWKVSGLKYINGQAYYQVATHLYVKAADGAQIYTTGNQAVQLYNRDGNAIGSVLGARTSWKVSSVYAHQGHVYYQVATNQFVRVY